MKYRSFISSIEVSSFSKNIFLENITDQMQKRLIKN